MTMAPWGRLAHLNIFLLIVFLSSVTSQTFRVLKIGQIELQGGKAPSEGNVMVSAGKDKELLPLCDDNFGMAEANAVCLRLGFPRALKFTRQNFFGQQQQSSSCWDPEGWMPMYNLDCPDVSGTSNITRCILSENQPDMCDISEVAGVVCQTSGDVPGCSDGNFVCDLETLSSRSCIPESSVCDGVGDCANGSDEDEKLCNKEGIVRLESNLDLDYPENTIAGNVYIKYNATWSPMCHPFFGQAEAEIVCRNLGYGGGMVQAIMGAYFGEGSEPILFTEFSCSGSEASLTQCPRFVWKQGSNCSTSAIAGVFCHTGNLDVHLVGRKSKSNSKAGHVEISSSSLPSSGAICGAGFDDLDAQVICRMLGHDPLQATSRKESPPGVESGFIWDFLLDCKGNEKNIQECKILVSNITCAPQDTAYVSCFRETKKSVDKLLRAVLPRDCGQPVDASNRFLTNIAKIRGGNVSSQFDVPWLVSLQYRTPTGYQHNCGAVIISEYYILSAAHCFLTQGKLDYIARVAEYNNNYDEPFQQDFFIDKLWIHEANKEISGFDNDIALLKIEPVNGRGIRLGERAQAVCLPRLGESYDGNLRSCTVAGWGTSTNDSLQSAVVPFIAKTFPIEDIECDRFYGSSRYSSSGACFWNNLANPCSGDSGGPVTCRGPNGRQTLYGIVSNGASCFPGYVVLDVNVRVTKYLKWIQETIYRDLRLD